MTDHHFAQCSAQLTRTLADLLLHRGEKVLTVESCTGGLLAATLTEMAGSSAWFDRAYVTYSNQAKQSCLGVSDAILQQHGAVSIACARAMALGALQHSAGVDWSVAITGIAGPGGGSAEKPVGTVCFAWGNAAQRVESSQQLFAGDRRAIRQQSTIFALTRLIELMQNSERTQNSVMTA